jgi:hypothetical protein
MLFFAARWRSIPQCRTIKSVSPTYSPLFTSAVKESHVFDVDGKESDEVRTRAGQRFAATCRRFVAYRTKRQVAAGRTMDIPDLVTKSGDDTAPDRSDG